MGIRDREIERLIHYAKGLGVKVVYRRAEPGTSATWSIDGSTIEIYGRKSKNKTDTILDLIHELGHHAWFIHEKDREPDLKFDEAITVQNLVEDDDRKNPAPKALRKKIYDVELAGTQWWPSIYKEVDIKIPFWKLEVAMEFDMWMYEVYYDTGFFPRGKTKRDKHKEITKKYRG